MTPRTVLIFSGLGKQLLWESEEFKNIGSNTITFFQLVSSFYQLYIKGFLTFIIGFYIFVFLLVSRINQKITVVNFKHYRRPKVIMLRCRSKFGIKEKTEVNNPVTLIRGS